MTRAHSEFVLLSGSREIFPRRDARHVCTSEQRGNMRYTPGAIHTSNEQMLP